MSATVKTKTRKKNATTQTNPMDTMLEIAHLQEQVKLLVIENEHLRKYTTEELSSRLKTTTPETSPNETYKTPKFPRSAQKKLQTPSTQDKNNKLSTRGCTCKGKCNSKICGCVKKNILCGVLCKCNIDVCKNQQNKDIDQNKENLENIEIATKHVENKEIKNKHLSNAAESKSIFSPDVAQGDSDFNIDEVRESLYFGSPKQLIFESNKEGEEEENDKQSKERKSTRKVTKLDKNDQKSVAKKKGKPRKLISEARITKHVHENEDILNKDGQDQDDEDTEKGVRKRIPYLEESQIDEKMKEVDKRTNNYMQNIANGMGLLRHGQKESKGSSTNKPNGRYVNNLGSEVVLRKSPDSTANSMETSHDESNNDFNPMEPKHELSRTPVHGLSTSSYRDDNFDISLATSVKLDEGRQIPEVFSQPEVNWEEYQSQLVACGKCKRKFHPLRIMKHESCCKKL